MLVLTVAAQVEIGQEGGDHWLLLLKKGLEEASEEDMVQLADVVQKELAK